MKTVYESIMDIDKTDAESILIYSLVQQHTLKEFNSWCSYLQEIINNHHYKPVKSIRKYGIAIWMDNTGRCDIYVINVPNNKSFCISFVDSLKKPVARSRNNADIDIRRMLSGRTPKFYWTGYSCNTDSFYNLLYEEAKNLSENNIVGL